jgi:(1->4)-alpha-D-glucan 1-alpha-D-glucosylmutase
VPDVYQGCELWDFSMVDPDNRRPVDYEARRKILGEIRSSIDSGEARRALARRLLDAPDDGAIKLYLTWTLLNHRRANRDLYERGDYVPLDVVGPHANRVVAFARTLGGRAVVVAAPRLVAPLMGHEARTLPVGDVWSGTSVVVPGDAWTDIVSGRPIVGRVVGLSELFASFPLGVMELQR